LSNGSANPTPEQIIEPVPFTCSRAIQAAIAWLKQFWLEPSEA